MSLRRLISVLSVVVVASAGAAVAQPKKAPAPAKGAPAPAPAPAPAAPAAGSGGGSGSGSGSGEGSAVQPIEDAPPADIEGREENPDAPRGDEATSVVAVPVATKPAGYPIEETQRPITLPANMAEVSIAPHGRASSPFAASDALRARYGITRQVQLGLTYVFGGIYDDPTTVKKQYAFHAGKAAGLEVTVLLTNWLAVKAGVPVYFDPFALSFAAGAPMKFIINEKLALGGLEDVINIRIHEFPPSFNQELFNAQGAYNKMNNTEQSRGILRFSGFAEYQQSPKLALLGRIGIESDLGAGGGGAAGSTTGSATTTFLRGGLLFTPKKFLDVGGTLGFDDLSTYRSFAFAGFLAVRI